MMPHIRRIRADEGPRLRALRLRALAEAPMAFGSTLAHEQGFPDDIWRERAVGASTGVRPGRQTPDDGCRELYWLLICPACVDPLTRSPQSNTEPVLSLAVHEP
jgi:hypothetical protein